MQSGSAGGAFRSAETVLIADVSDPSARVYAAICHLAGYNTCVCPPGDLHSPLPHACRPDIVVIGVAQASTPRPTICGVAMTIPAVLISAAPADAGRASELNYAAVLTRPVMPSQLRETIRRLLVAGRAGRPRPGRELVRADAERRAVMRAIEREASAELLGSSRRLRAASDRLCRRASELRRKASDLSESSLRLRPGGRASSAD